MNERHRRGLRHREAMFDEGRRGGRMRRGDIRTALLATLAEAPGHGYDLMQSLENKTGGAWRPSPGSVYPTLQLLEDEGLVRSSERGGKKVAQIVEQIRRQFSSFGGGHESTSNPLATALKDQPPMFAAGVDIERVVRLVITEVHR